jgi:hypothetical protein
LRYDGCSAVAAIQHSDINSLLHGVIRSLATTRLHKAVLQAVLIFIVHVSTMLMHLHISYGYSNMIGVALVHFPFLPRSQGETGGGDGDDVARFDELLAPSTTGEPSPLDDEEFVAATMPDVCESCDRLTGRLSNFSRSSVNSGVENSGLQVGLQVGCGISTMVARQSLVDPEQPMG